MKHKTKQMEQKENSIWSSYWLKKRNQEVEPFLYHKLKNSILKAFPPFSEDPPVENIAKRAMEKTKRLDETENLFVYDASSLSDSVIDTLNEFGFLHASNEYKKHRDARAKFREANSPLMKTMADITFTDANQSDVKRENANINGDTPMGMMLKYGSESAKQFYDMYVLNPEHAQAHREGNIHIHDLDFYALTTTCCQIDLLKLFDGGFSTGHGSLREPQHIASYAALCCIAIQSNQNDQHGGQSIVNFDYGMAPGVRKTFTDFYKRNLVKALRLHRIDKLSEDEVFSKIQLTPSMQSIVELNGEMADVLTPHCGSIETNQILDFVLKESIEETDHATYKAMVSLIHNLNTMHSRAGAQIPFSSINYGMDTSPEGRMVIKNLLLATEAGLGRGETPIFPIQIFRVKEGVNYNPQDPNYDLFRLAIRTSAKRLFPNFSFLDAPFNAQCYKGTPETEIAYMGCRTRVIGNVYDPQQEVCNGRGNLSFTSINLPRIAIKAKGNTKLFFEELDKQMDVVFDQLDHRLEIQSKKKVYNYPFLMGEGVWLDSEKLSWEDEVREVLKHGTLSVGFIGLAETLKCLVGKHHGESHEAQLLGLLIVKHMRDKCDERSAEKHLNYTLLATPAEGLSGRFVRLDRERYGVIEGVTDKEYYTNSFHVPVHYEISAFDKIHLEASYHPYTNAGHITYVEMDGDPSRNLEAFESVIRAMKEAGVGYGSINHPVDRDPVCGFNGIIYDECPKCGRREADGGEGFERIRRITGYLVGTLNRFNNAKRAEEKDRVKHNAPQVQDIKK